MENPAKLLCYNEVNLSIRIYVFPKIPKGIAHIVTILVAILLLGGVGFVAYRSSTLSNKKYDQNQPAMQGQEKKTESTAQADETANWTLFTSSSGWNMRIPDGWELHTDLDSKNLTAFALLLEHKPGIKAIIHRTESGRGGPFVFSAVKTTVVMTLIRTCSHQTT